MGEKVGTGLGVIHGGRERWGQGEGEMGTRLGKYGSWDGGRKRGFSIPRDGGIGTEMEVGVDKDTDRKKDT